jgi:SnoaL-like domain
MSNAPAASEIQRLLDKQTITEVLYRYSRGVDRCDRSTLATVYWPDAEDDHMVFRGSGDALLDYLSTAVLHMRTQHRLANILIEFDGADSARSESYVVAYHNVAVENGREDVIFGGRYLDRFEKRGGEWRIAHRKLVMDFFQRQPAAADLGVFGALPITGGHYPADPLYETKVAPDPQRNGGRGA